MKFAMVGALVGAGLVVFALQYPSPSGEALAERFAPQRTNTHEVSESSDLIVLSATADEQGAPVEQVTIVDPKSRAMAVYHVKKAGASGETVIELKSVRKFEWDLQMEEFNATSPLPREVRSQVIPNLQRR
ncbi:MAG TPA: hypothetical protein VG125_22290 [Pirellulales bacterium]|jgi:hypothetical protein|nr:hypothetical protein [Pirellulales bacterium]